MKSTVKKIVLIVGCGLIVLGIALSIVGLGISHFDMDQLYQRENQHTQGSYTVPQNIYADLDDANISVFSGETDQVTIVSNGVELDISQRGDGTLIIKNKMNWKKWYEFVELDLRRADVEITLPAEFDGSISLKSDYGDISIQGIHVSQNLTVEKEDGDLTVTNCSIGGTMDLEQDYGTTVLDNITGNSFKLDYSDGKTTLSNLAFTNRLEISGESGDMQLENITAQSGFMELEDGSIYVNNTQYQEKVLMELEYGTIQLNGVTAQLLEFDVEDGNVEGTLLGSKTDYKVSTQMKDGRSNLETSHTGEKEIRAKIEYGNLNLNFEQ